MKKHLTSEPVEHIDPAHLVFYLTWERRYLKYPNPVKKSEKKWRFWLSTIGLSLVVLAIVSV